MSSSGVGGTRAPPLSPAGGAAGAGRKGREVRGARRDSGRRGECGEHRKGSARGVRAGRARVPPSKVSCSRTATRASCGSDASRLQLGRGPAPGGGGGRRETDRPRQEPGSREGPGRRVPEPGPPGTARGRCCGGPDGRPPTLGFGADRRRCPRRSESPRPARARPAARYLPSEQVRSQSRARGAQRRAGGRIRAAGLRALLGRGDEDARGAELRRRRPCRPADPFSARPPPPSACSARALWRPAAGAPAWPFLSRGGRSAPSFQASELGSRLPPSPLPKPHPLPSFRQLFFLDLQQYINSSPSDPPPHKVMQGSHFSSLLLYHLLFQNSNSTLRYCWHQCSILMKVFLISSTNLLNILF